MNLLPLLCPLCREPLLRERPAWRCANGHAFDVAREGYVNLLPVQQRKSKSPGDNAAMVRARRDFLDAGHYAPLRAALAGMLSGLPAGVGVDIGCGEGYYTECLRAGDDEVIGIDIARDAVQRAAKRYPGITWLVAGSAALPLADACCARAISLFAPLPAAEVVRVLRPGGHLLVATPAADHLWTLREALFAEVRAHEPEKILGALAADFRLLERREVRFALSLDATALAQLLLMTPYAWRATRARRDALAARESLATTAAFSLFLLARSP